MTNKIRTFSTQFSFVFSFSLTIHCIYAVSASSVSKTLTYVSRFYKPTPHYMLATLPEVSQIPLLTHTHRFKTTRRESRLREGVCRQGFCYVRARQPLRGTGGWGAQREANSLKRKQETLHIWTGSKDNRKSGMSNLTVLFSESQCIKN